MHTQETTCCFTGHRPAKLPWGSDENDERCILAGQKLREQLQDLIGNGYRHFLCGMALGSDMLFAEAVLELKEQYSDITLNAAVPCETQAHRWNAAQKARYKDILARCDSVKTFQERYTPGCMQTRNKYMVDNSSAIITYYNGLPGGTMTTIVYAQRQGLDIRMIDIS